MKSCPECNRTFEDTFSFCLVDGAILSAPFQPEAGRPDFAKASNAPPPTEVISSTPPPDKTAPSPIPPPPPDPTIRAPYQPAPRVTPERAAEAWAPAQSE